jgi:hypothetical protein
LNDQGIVKEPTALLHQLKLVAKKEPAEAGWEITISPYHQLKLVAKEVPA